MPMRRPRSEKMGVEVRRVGCLLSAVASVVTFTTRSLSPTSRLQCPTFFPLPRLFVVVVVTVIFVVPYGGERVEVVWFLALTGRAEKKSFLLYSTVLYNHQSSLRDSRRFL